MNTINKYLHYLNEGNNYKDESMPNPYDYQSIDLDPKVTKQDLKILGRWLKKNKNLADPDITTEPVEWLFYSSYREYGVEPGTYEQAIKNRHAKTFTIIDKKKRVGVVALSETGSFIWASWTPGYNYAVRGTMKMVEYLLNKNPKEYKNYLWRTNIYTKNTPSLKVAKKLKMRLWNKHKTSYSYELKNKEVWWIEKKKKKGWFKKIKYL